MKSTTPKETADRQDHHPPQIEVVRTWFREERYRLKRQFEFRAEVSSFQDHWFYHIVDYLFDPLFIYYIYGMYFGFLKLTIIAIELRIIGRNKEII